MRCAGLRVRRHEPADKGEPRTTLLDSYNATVNLPKRETLSPETAIKPPTDNRPLQKAWIVTDIEAAARRWSALFGIGPFHVAEYGPDIFEYVNYRGEPGKLHMKTAIAYAGDEQIELVEPVGEYASAYSDTIPHGKTGFHHICFWTDDIDADIAHFVDAGAEVANDGKMLNGPRFAYVDASASLGIVIELLERAPGVVQLFDAWRETCHSWDGREPIIRL